MAKHLPISLIVGGAGLAAVFTGWVTIESIKAGTRAAEVDSIEDYKADYFTPAATPLNECLRDAVLGNANNYIGNEKDYLVEVVSGGRVMTHVAPNTGNMGVETHTVSLNAKGATVGAEEVSLWFEASTKDKIIIASVFPAMNGNMIQLSTTFMGANDLPVVASVFLNPKELGRPAEIQYNDATLQYPKDVLGLSARTQAMANILQHCKV